MSKIKISIEIEDNDFKLGRFESDNVTINDLGIAITQMELIKQDYLEKIRTQTKTLFKRR